MNGKEKRVIWQETTLMCDECHRESETFPVDESLIGKQCRWCEADMLSQKEYDDFYRKPKAIVDWMNKWFSWIPFISGTNEESQSSVTIKYKD